MDSEELGRWSAVRLGQLGDFLRADRQAQLRKMELVESHPDFLREQGVTRYLSKQIETIRMTITRLQRGEKQDGRSERTGY